MSFRKIYKKKFNNLAVLLGTALLITITTTNTMAAIDTTDTVTTYYQDLMNAFDKAGKAHIGDFPKLTNFSSSRTKCIIVDKRRPYHLTNMVVGKFSEITKGSPDNGPLFPPTPDEETIRLVLLPTDFFKTKKDNEKIEDFVLRTYFVEYQKTLPRIISNEFDDLQTISWTPDIKDFSEIMSFRKSGSELYFHMLYESSSVNAHEEAYGYCYKK